MLASWRWRPPRSTLPSMAKTQAEADARSPFEWTRDPLVLVSRRIRDLSFPGALLLRDPTEADLRRWRDTNSRTNNVNEHKVRVLAGVTFLGALTTAWALRAVTGPGQAPRSAPADDALILVRPTSSADGLLNGHQFVDRDTRKVVPRLVHEAWLRVMRWLEREDVEGARERGERPLIFGAADGHDAPECMLVPLSEVLRQSTEAGRQAYPAVVNSFRWHKDGRHLGALHDYAVRDAAAWPLVDGMRQRLGKAPSLAPR